jgi:quercetin dioxygenase-like cupin family protein
MNLIKEEEIETLDMPGRKLKWLFRSGDGIAKHCSMNVVSIAPGETVHPAHAHPEGEELIYVVSGAGQVLVDGRVGRLAEGTAVLFSQGSIHMVRNDGGVPLKLACFFAPPASFDSYEYHEEVAFPDQGEE